MPIDARNRSKLFSYATVAPVSITVRSELNNAWFNIAETSSGAPWMLVPRLPDWVLSQ